MTELKGTEGADIQTASYDEVLAIGPHIEGKLVNRLAQGDVQQTNLGVVDDYVRGDTSAIGRTVTAQVFRTAETEEHPGLFVVQKVYSRSNDGFPGFIKYEIRGPIVKMHEAPEPPIEQLVFDYAAPEEFSLIMLKDGSWSLNQGLPVINSRTVQQYPKIEEPPEGPNKPQELYRILSNDRTRKQLHAPTAPDYFRKLAGLRRTFERTGFDQVIDPTNVLAELRTPHAA